MKSVSILARKLDIAVTSALRWFGMASGVLFALWAWGLPR